MTLRALAVSGMLAAVSCQHDSARDANAAAYGDTAAQTLLRELDSKSRTLALDTLHVIPPDADSTGWEGASLDSGHALLKNAYGNQDDGSFALYAVPMPNRRRGFLLRTPSQYSSSAIDLWVYDEAQGRWQDTARVADAFGDGEWYFVQDGWLADLDRDGWPDLITRRRDWWVDDATGQEHQSDSLLVRAGSPTGFGAPRLRIDSLLRSRFDVAHWPNPRN